MLQGLINLFKGVPSTDQFNATVDEHKRVAERSIRNSRRNSGFARDLRVQAEGAIRTLNRHWDDSQT